MSKWQPKEAFWRAFKTFLQTFAGSLPATSVVLDPSLIDLMLSATFAASVAAIYAFAMNLEVPAGVEAEEPILTEIVNTSDNPIPTDPIDEEP